MSYHNHYAMPIEDMTDEELIGERNYWNKLLTDLFFQSSGAYDSGAMVLKQIELEMLRRDLEGPPWVVD